MSGPITWKNVGSTISTNGISSLMSGASINMNKATKGVAGILDNIQKQDKRNWNQIKENNTNKLMQELRKHGSLEELEQAKAAGVFQQLTDGMGAQYDAEKFGSALDNRGNVLMERDATQDEYTDRNLRIDQRGLVDDYFKAKYAGDDATADKIAEQFKIDGAKYMGKGFDIDNQQAQETRAQQSHGLNSQLTRLSIQGKEQELARAQVQQAADQLGNHFLSIAEQNPSDISAAREGFIASLSDLGLSTNQQTAQIEAFDTAVTTQGDNSPLWDTLTGEAVNQVYQANGGAENIYINHDLRVSGQNMNGGAPGNAMTASARYEKILKTADEEDLWNGTGMGVAERSGKTKDVKRLIHEGVSINASELLGSRTGIENVSQLNELGIRVSPNGSVQIPVPDEVIMSGIRTAGDLISFSNDDIDGYAKSTIRKYHLEDFIRSRIAAKEAEDLKKLRDGAGRN